MRDAYLALLGGDDPAAAHLGGAVDLRPETTAGPVTGVVVTSGPDDLRELREALEQITGPGTWPYQAKEPAATDLRLTATLEQSSPAALLRLVWALESRIADRTGAWRTWRTVVESVATLLTAPCVVTVDTVVSGDLSDEFVD